MFDDISLPIKFGVAFIVVLALIALTAWLVRRFGSERLGTGTVRGRQPRLAVIDAASVDGRRRLVLIRRDNVEHLMMIGGPTDVVVEANIVRGAAPAREAPAPRAPAATDTLPRAVPLGEGSTWPLQPEPIPAPPPAPRVEPPAPRAPLRQTVAPPPPPPPEPPASITAEEEAEWAQPEPELAPPPPPPPEPAPQRRARPVQEPQLTDLAEELARAQPQPQPQPEPAPEPRMPPRREPRIARPQTPAPPPPSAPPQAPAHAPAADAQFSSPADQNLAEMAQRLEAALRRPARTDSPAEPAPRAAPARAAPARAAPAYEPPAAEPEDYAPAPPPPPQRAPEVRPARSEARPARADRAPAGLKSSVYDSLEQEMASLLGRPNSKS